MHFRPAFPDDFVAALTAIKAAGLTPALLEDYVGLARPAPPRRRPADGRPPPTADPDRRLRPTPGTATHGAVT